MFWLTSHTWVVAVMVLLKLYPLAGMLLLKAEIFIDPNAELIKVDKSGIVGGLGLVVIPQVIGEAVSVLAWARKGNGA